MELEKGKLPDPSVPEARTLLRKEKIAARDGLSPAERAEKSEIICRRIASLPMYEKARTVLIYNYVRGEVQLTELDRMNRELPKDQRRILAYPVCRGEEMIAVVPADSDSDSASWNRGSFGIREPDPETGTVLNPEQIDLIVCPCTAFDETGMRLGMGGGFYDRYLPKCTNAKFVEAAFEVQKTDRVPAMPWDVPVPVIVTEEGIYGSSGI